MQFNNWEVFQEGCAVTGKLKTQSLALFNNSFAGLTMTILQEVEVSSKEKAPKINAFKPGGLNFERVEGDGG